jgi:hypothetical protein
VGAEPRVEVDATIGVVGPHLQSLRPRRTPRCWGRERHEPRGSGRPA